MESSSLHSPKLLDELPSAREMTSVTTSLVLGITAEQMLGGEERSVLSLGHQHQSVGSHLQAYSLSGRFFANTSSNVLSVDLKHYLLLKFLLNLCTITE